MGRPGTCNPDGNTRLLERESIPDWTCRMGMIVLALVVEFFLTPDARDDLQSFVEQFGPHLAVCLLAKLCKASFNGSQPHRQDDATIGEMIQGRRFAG